MTQPSPAFPSGSTIDRHGRLRLGGCDAIELAREFGTPAYVFVEEDLRNRARAFQRSAAAAVRESATLERFTVVFASKACPCTPVLSLFAEEGLSCDVASGGELHLALSAGLPAQRLVVHGNAKSIAELRQAVSLGAGLIVLDNATEIERLVAVVRELRAGKQAVLVRINPDVRGETHEKISTGQADSKFGFSMADAPSALRTAEAAPELDVLGLHVHIGSQLLELEPFRAAAAALARVGSFPIYDLGGGLGVAYTRDQKPPPTIEQYVAALSAAAPGSARELMIEPGRSLVANGCVTLYTVESVKQNVSRWVSVDGGMSDNVRPMLYGARYEAHVADRFGGSARCKLAGKHCESGDVIVRDALLDEPLPGDVVVTPATGAYCLAMASNYNGATRLPVIFCHDGHAREVVRRESFTDLQARDLTTSEQGRRTV